MTTITKTRPTQYGPTRNRLTKQQGLQLKGPAELAAGELISPAAACRFLNDNQAGLYVAEGRIASWICEKLIPSQSYTARDGRSCALLYRKHVDYLKDFLVRISSEEPTKRGREAETRKAAQPAAVAPAVAEPAAEPPQDGQNVRAEQSAGDDAPVQELFQFDRDDPARAVFDVLNINARVAAVERTIRAADSPAGIVAYAKRLDALEKTLKALAEKVTALNEKIAVLCNADNARQFALKELWEHVADIRKDQMRRIADEEAARAERLKALDDEARELIGE
ncbi:MAG: hypothetical protein K6E55_07160 [Thermoguttaceae bacterium]|nr:hypothetical protein [Thermoguttaceae bacterium]